MKKIFFIVVISVLAGMQLGAQERYDTIYERFPNYHYNWYDSVWDKPATHDGLFCYSMVGPHIIIFDTNPNVSAQDYLPKGVFAETAVQYVPDNSIHLVGVAFGEWDTSDYLYSLCYALDEQILPRRLHAVATHHVNIYDKQMNLLQSVSLPYNCAQTVRYMYQGHSILANYYVLPVFSRMKHVYLDFPMDMTDTFYISRVITYNDSVWQYNDTWSTMENHFTVSGSTAPFTQIRHMPWEYYKFRTSQLWNDLVNCPWRDDYTFGYQHALMYPIVENPGDSCPQVHDVEVLRSNATHAFLRWQAGANHRRWQVAYGPAGTPPEECTVLEYDRAMSDLIAVDPDSQYVAYVRAFCRMAYDEWGPWSDPALIWLNAPSEGVADADNAGLKVEVTPNPTDGKVRIKSTAIIDRVVLLDAAGNVLRTVGARGTDFTLDLTGLPSATYFLSVHTQAGTATKKLTVTR